MLTRLTMLIARSRSALRTRTASGTTVVVEVEEEKDIVEIKFMVAVTIAILATTRVDAVGKNTRAAVVTATEKDVDHKKPVAASVAAVAVVQMARKRRRGTRNGGMGIDGKRTIWSPRNPCKTERVMEEMTGVEMGATVEAQPLGAGIGTVASGVITHGIKKEGGFLLRSDIRVVVQNLVARLLREVQFTTAAAAAVGATAAGGAT